MYIGNKKLSLPKLPAKFKKVKISNLAKKNIIIFASVLLIGGAIWLNWSFFSNGGNAKGRSDNTKTNVTDNSDAKNVDKSNNSVDEYFVQTQIDRQRARDESMEVLQLIVDNEDALEDVKQEALAEINKIAANIEAEANIESLVMAKGFEDCVAVIGENSATVIVKTTGLKENEITQIQEIVYEQTGITPVNLKIKEKG